MMSAYVKIPLQLLILGTGVLVFVFYLFEAPPIVFNRVYDAQIAAGAYAGEYAALGRPSRPGCGAPRCGGARRSRGVHAPATRASRRLAQRPSRW